MAITLLQYKKILQNVEFWKFIIHLYYRDVEFKFRNTGAGNNGASKLTIYGITPLIGDTTVNGAFQPILPKQYVIYTELRGINLERWNVRVPYILDGGSSTPEGGWNVLDPDVGNGYRIEAGLSYKSAFELSRDKFFDNTKLRMFWGWSYADNVRDSTDSATFSIYDTGSDRGFAYNINTSGLLVKEVGDLVQTYGEHPCVVLFSTNTSVDLTNRKFYNVVPVGIEYYKVTLELANGESVTRFFDTSWNPTTVSETVLDAVNATRGRG
jgi:hypothetical protein